MISKSKLAQAYYDMATMLEAGLPILRSLDIVIQGREKHLQRVFECIRDTISQGSNLSEAMDAHPNVFGEMDRMLIEAGETSGSLADSFKMLAQWYDFTHKITRRMLAGLLLPFLILHIAALVFPLPSLILGGLGIAGYFLKAFSIVLLLYIPTAIVVAVILLKGRAESLRVPLDFFVLRIPILGQAIYQLSICRYTKAFAMLYKAGVPIMESTTRATRATGNAMVAGQFAGGMASVRQGGTAYEGLSQRLPLEYLHLWQVGEEVGELDRSVEKIAEMSGDRADLYFTEFARWMPRLVYAMVAAVLIAMIFSLAGRLPSYSAGAF